MSEFTTPVVASENTDLLGYGRHIENWLRKTFQIDVFTRPGVTAFIGGSTFSDFLVNIDAIETHIDLLIQADTLAAFAQLKSDFEAPFAISQLERYTPSAGQVKRTITVHISLRPDVTDYFATLTESLNGFLYDGTTLWCHPDAETAASSRVFSTLHADRCVMTPKLARSSNSEEAS